MKLIVAFDDLEFVHEAATQEECLEALDTCSVCCRHLGVKDGMAEAKARCETLKAQAQAQLDSDVAERRKRGSG